MYFLKYLLFISIISTIIIEISSASIEKRKLKCKNDNKKHWKKRALLLKGNDFTSISDSNQIVNIQNGISTTVNASGIFVQQINQNNNNYLVDLNLDDKFDDTNQIVDMSDAYEPGQSVTVLNDIVTISNSSGIFIGNLTNGIFIKVSDYYEPSSYTTYTFSDENQSVSVVNGLITLSNSTGIFIGRSFDNLVQVGL